jgi:predicted ester cyclase
MTSNIENKQRLYDFSQSVHDATPDTVEELLSEHYHENVTWHSHEPTNELQGVDAVATEFWEPLLSSFPDLEKNQHILFGGRYRDADWVCSTGNMVGTFEEDWNEIPATGHATWLQYGEFHRFEDGKIVETRVLIDVLDVMRQAGYRFIPAMAPEVVNPGPATNDGVQLGEHDPEESEQTLQLVKAMLFEGLNPMGEWTDETGGMEQYWHDDFMWYGPAGTGTSRGIDGFIENHAGPFHDALPDWKCGEEGGDHEARFAEGRYAATTGWPDVTATHTGDGWLGLPATDEFLEMRVMDFWRREGDLLAENWVFIDKIHLLQQMGVDIYERLREDKQHF